MLVQQEYDTVHRVLVKSIEIADDLSQNEVAVVLDQAIYSKVQQITWSNEKFSD